MGAFDAVCAMAAHARTVCDMMLCSWMPLYSTLQVASVDLRGKTAIVSGANVGIGLECARKLASFNATVILACRNAEKAENARCSLMAETGNTSIEVEILDCSELDSVRSFVTRWGSKPIDILINNAGITPTHFNISKSGHEECFTTNYLSHLLLTLLLLPCLRPDGRIVNVSSMGHFFGAMQPDDLDASRWLQETHQLKEGDVLPPDVFMGLYAKSKLAQVMFARELQARLDESPEHAKKGIIVTSVHPGLVKTSMFTRNENISSSTDAFYRKTQHIMNRVGISAEQGACTPVFCATAPPPRLSPGRYYDRQAVRYNNAQVEDQKTRQELWVAWLKAAEVPELL